MKRVKLFLDLHKHLASLTKTKVCQGHKKTPMTQNIKENSQPFLTPKKNIEGFNLKHEVPPLWPTFIGERRTTFPKAYGIESEVLLGTL
jgi:hypothetical protein